MSLVCEKSGAADVQALIVQKRAAGPASQIELEQVRVAQLVARIPETEKSLYSYIAWDN